MECEDVRSLLARYLDNDLPPEPRRSVEEHLDHCYLCKEEYEELAGLLEACGKAMAHPNPKDRYTELRRELFPAVTRANVLPFRRRSIMGTIAAAAAVILIAIYGGERLVGMVNGVSLVMDRAAVAAPFTPIQEPVTARMPLLLSF